MSSESIAALARALDGFFGVRRQVDEVLQEVRARPDVRHRTGALAEDLFESCQLLIESHTAASAATDHSHSLLDFAVPWPELPEVVRNSDDPEIFRSWALSNAPTREAIEHNLAVALASLDITNAPDARAKIAYKSVFFTVSALQDSLSGAFLEARGDHAARRPRMYEALKDGKPLRVLLDARESTYRSWFLDWRDKRNTVKEGITFGITGHPELGITFTSADEGGGVVDCSGANSVYLSDITRAVKASTEIAQIVVEIADQQRTKPNCT